MNFVFKPNMIIAYGILFIAIVLPGVLGWFGIDALAFLFQPVITMIAFLLAGICILGPYMMNPARGFLIFILLLLVAGLLTLGIHYGTINPLETYAMMITPLF